MSADERILIEHARLDPDAFRKLYRQYFDRVYAYVACRVGRAQDAEDLTADVFIKVVESLARFEYRGDGSFAAWLFRIAHNRVNQFYRERQRCGEPLSLDELPDIRSGVLLPDEAVLRKERFAHLRDCILMLSPRRREVVTLKFFGGLRNQEIAAALGLDERSVASHLCRALDDLQRMVELEREYHDG